MFRLSTSRLKTIIESLVLLLILKNFCILQTAARFFIETIDKNDCYAEVRLYACDEENKMPVLLPGGNYDSARSPRLKPSHHRPTLVCKEITDRKQKQQIYSKANFYLVVGTSLVDGRRVILKSDKRLPTVRTLPYWFLLGVSIFDGELDYPALTKSESALQVLKLRCDNIKMPVDFLEGVMSVQDLVLYLSINDFRTFLHPRQGFFDQMRSFAKVLDKVEGVFNRVCRLTLQNKVTKRQRAEAQNKIKSVVEFLIQKLIDPCALKSPSGEMSPSKNFDPSAVCNSYCKFLAVGFLVNQAGSSKGRRLVRGVCSTNKCLCESQRAVLCVELRPLFVPMVKCSNALRLRMAVVAKSLTYSEMRSIFGYE